LSSGRFPHALLFTGPAGVGRELAAAASARRLLCERPTGLDGCGACEDCTLLAAGSHPDYHRIYRLLARFHSEKRVRDRKAVELSVDVIREFVLAPVMLRPSRGRAKVFVICEAERLSEKAQNALLKTLEEPPRDTFVILISASPDAMFSTTRSRCCEVAFRALPDDYVAEEIRRRTSLGAADARFVANLAQGSLGAALGYAGADLMNGVRDVAHAVRKAQRDPLASGQSLLETAKGIGEAMKRAGDDEGDTNVARNGQLVTIAIVAALLRDVARVAAGLPAVATSADWFDAAALAGSTDQRSIGAAIRSVARAEYEIHGNVNAGLIFDGVGIALSRGLRPLVEGQIERGGRRRAN
jgi:DNA polymerase-3 subunit delta'